MHIWRTKSLKVITVLKLTCEIDFLKVKKRLYMKMIVANIIWSITYQKLNENIPYVDIINTLEILTFVNFLELKQIFKKIIPSLGLNLVILVF